MKLLEYEAKQILTAHGVPTPRSYIAGESAEFLPAVLKSQVPVGGRGKAGGVLVVQSADEYIAARQNILTLDIKGFTANTVLAEELITIDRELYLSVLIDKPTATIKLMAHSKGGIEVEDQTDFRKWEMRDDKWDELGQDLSDYFDLPEQTFALQDLVENLYKIFTKNDALLLEINPLILTSAGKLIAGDCKMELDDAAAFRHPEWRFEAEKSEVNFVTLDPQGVVATVANGAGLAMATVDAVADSGLTPANFLDIGGGANEASILAAFERLMEYPNLQVILINIFAGITRCDEVARAIVAARAKITNLPPLTVRLAGTNYQEAAAILAEHNIALQPSLADAIANAKQEVSI